MQSTMVKEERVAEEVTTFVGEAGGGFPASNGKEANLIQSETLCCLFPKKSSEQPVASCK